MSLPVLTIIIITLSYAGVFFLFRKKKFSMLAGMEYLFVGLLLSLMPARLELIKPLLYIFPGWIGLLTGSQIRIVYLQRLDGFFYCRLILFACCYTAILTATLCLLDKPLHAAAAAIALTPVSYILIAQALPSDRYVLFFMSLLPVCTIFMLTLVYGLAAGSRYILLSLGSISCFAILSRFILSHIDDKKSIGLLLIGLVIFVSEYCAVFCLSPLVIGFFIGVYLANFCPLHELVFKSLYRDEKPLYVMFLLIVGMFSGFSTKAYVFIYAAAMLVASLMLTWLLKKIRFFKLACYPLHLLGAPGGFSIALCVDFWLYESAPRGVEWFSALLLVIVLLQFYSVSVSKFSEA